MKNMIRPDPGQVRQSFDRSAATYDHSAVLEKEILERLMQRQDLVRLDPGLIIDGGTGTGRALPFLRQRYPDSRIMAVDFAGNMVSKASKADCGQTAVCADLYDLPVADNCVDLIFCNLVLPWINDIDRVFSEFYRVLQPRGLLSFTSYGPDTLYELREAWRAATRDNRVIQFVDMHDVGDALIRNGLVEPVMDTEHITLTYGNIGRLIDDLTKTGARVLDCGDMPDQQEIELLGDSYEHFRYRGKLPATYEVVYGHAWAPVEKRARPAGGGEYRIPAREIGLRRRDR